MVVLSPSVSQSAKEYSQAVAVAVTIACCFYTTRNYNQVRSLFNLLIVIVTVLFMVGNTLKLIYHFDHDIKLLHYIGETFADIGIALYGSLLITRYRAFRSFVWCPDLLIKAVHVVVWAQAIAFLSAFWAGYSSTYTAISDPLLLLQGGKHCHSDQTHIRRNNYNWCIGSRQRRIPSNL
jgi:hypothetical protein